MTNTRKLPLSLAALLALGACNAPNPNDYGGGEKGKAIAKCILRTERADSAVTREQAGQMCTCVTDKTFAALSNGGMGQSSLKRSLISCATDAGIEITD